MSKIELNKRELSTKWSLLESLEIRKEIKSKIVEFGKGWCKLNNLNYAHYIKHNENYTNPINYINREIEKVEKELKKY